MKKEIKARSRSAKHGTRLMGEGNALRPYENEEGFLKAARRWMSLHIVTQGILSGLAMLLEIAMFFIMTANSKTSTSPEFYIIKYVAAPAGCNLLMILTNVVVVYQTNIPVRVKEIVVGLSFSVSAFVVATVHGLFPSIFSVFVLPIVLTTVYGSYMLTNIVSGACIVLETVSAFCIFWDNSKVIDTDYTMDIFVQIGVQICVYAASLMIIMQERHKQAAALKGEQERDMLQDALFRDDLSGVRNKLGFLNDIRRLGVVADKSCHLVMFDIDNFKKVNDTYGHLKGDEVLIQFGALLNEHCENGTAYRFGGDEFCILYKGVPLYTAVDNVKLIHRIFGEVFGDEDMRRVGMSLSAGIASYTAGMSFEQLTDNADAALYKSKRGEKNKVTVYSRDERIKSR